MFSANALRILYFSPLHCNYSIRNNGIPILSGEERSTDDSIRCFGNIVSTNSQNSIGTGNVERGRCRHGCDSYYFTSENKKTPEEPKIQEPENKFDKYSDAKANNPRLADIGSNFITSISRLPSIKELANLNILLEYLPGLSLDEQYVLDDYNPSRPRSIGKNLSLYARLKTVEKPRDIDFPEIYDRIHREIEIRSNSKAKADEMLGERKPLPEREDPFKHITLPFTEEAIWRAYLLKQTDHLIGMYWHGLYNKRIFINKAEDIDSISPIHCDYELKNLDIIKAEAKKCWSDNMCPLVVLDGDKAYVSHYWFDHWHGLKQVQCLVSYDHTSHTITDFQIKECEPIIRYHCGMYY